MITVLSTTPLIAPVYNPIYVVVSSDKTTEEGFSFVFDLYVNGTFVGRTRLQPIPGTTQCVYSPARILESYISYDLSQDTVGTAVSANCIDMYEIKVAEEYVAYWNYQNNSNDTILGTSFVQLNAVSTPQPFTNGDQVLITQASTNILNIRYDGAHTIVASNTLSIVINVNYAGGNINGKVCYADKRKTLFFLDPSIIFNSALIQADAGWALPYGPDSCGVTLDWAGPTGIRFTVPDVSCLTAVQDLFNAYPYVGTNLYKVKFTVSNINNPSGESIYVTPWVGGTTGTAIAIPSTGTYEQLVTGGGLSTFKLILDLSNVDTSGFGSHSITFSSIELIDTTLVLSGYDINAVVQYEDQNIFNYSDYKLQTGTVGKFLTYSPRTLKTKLNDRGSLGILLAEDPQELFPGITYNLNIDVTDISGNIVNYSFPITGLDNASLTNDKYQHLGAYPWNINQLAIGQGAGTIIDTFTKSYKFHINGFYMGNDLPVSETFNFIIDTDCSKFETVRFMFKNSLGSFDYFNATLLSRTNINITKDNYTKTLGYGYQLGDRGRTVLNVNAQETYTITSNWITEATCYWLAYEMFLSNEIYVFDSTQRYVIPIILDNTSVEPKKRVNDSLLNYTFNYSKAVTVNTARG